MKNGFDSIKNIFFKVLGFVFSPLTFLFKRFLSIKSLKDFKSALETPDIQRRIVFTFFLVIAFRVLAVIPLPGVNSEVYREAITANTGSAFSNLLTIATGGQIDTPSLTVIGLGAYINASIIIQLLTSVIPKLEELKKEGERGTRVLTQLTRTLTVPLAMLQGFVIYTVIKQNTAVIPGTNFTISQMVDGLAAKDVAIMILAITAGSMVLMWISELITENGIGNGSSVIIMVGVLSVLPSLVVADFRNSLDWAIGQLQDGNVNALWSSSVLFMLFILIGFIVLVGIIVFVNEATRKITVQYARRVRGIESAQTSFLPFKLMQAGVMPIIFASSMLTFPTIVAQFALTATEPTSRIYKIAEDINSLSIFNLNSTEHLVFYAILIVVFTFFYTFIVMRPEETAENLQKSGGFIPGIRPGESTTRHITGIMLRLTTVGAVIIAFIALVPSLIRLTDQGSNLLLLTGFGGTSLLIIVGVLLDTNRQMKSLTVSRSYEMYK